MARCLRSSPFLATATNGEVDRRRRDGGVSAPSHYPSVSRFQRLPPPHLASQNVEDQLDENHAKKLAIYMTKGLASAAKMRRLAAEKPIPPAFDSILRQLGEQPYFSLQPLVCNIRNVPPGGNGEGGIRGFRLETTGGETAAFRVFLSERHILWVVDGQHRRHAVDLAMTFLDQVRQTGKYPGKGAVLFVEKGRVVTEDEMLVWNEAYEAARAYATLTVEVHLGSVDKGDSQTA